MDIKRNLVFLSQNITNLSGILTYLLQEDVISESEREYIKTRSTFMERNEELLLLMMRKNWENNRKLFLKVLRGTKNGHCAYKIEETHKSESMKRRMTELGQSLGDIKVPRLHNDFEEQTKDKEILPQIWFGVRAPTKYYVGRKEEKEKLDGYWNDCMENNTFSIVAVTGLGGVGKTEFARNYTNLFFKNVKGHTIWIDAETPQSIEQSFRNLAENELRISHNQLGNEKTFLGIVGEVYKKLFGEKVLLVFNNLENYDQEVLKLLIDLSSKKPPTVMKPFVIITSRLVETKKYFGSHCHFMELQILPKHSAEEFFVKSLSLSGTSISSSISELITRLGERLQFFPLAMQQASSYFNVRSPFCGTLQGAIRIYLDEMEKHSKDLLNYNLPEYEAMDDISKTTFLTWRITVDRLREESEGVAVDIMNIIAFLFPDHIPTHIVKFILQRMKGTSTSENVDTVFDLIRKYSMIEYSGVKLISVHRLVQEVTRIELEERGEFRMLLNEIATGITDMPVVKHYSWAEQVQRQAIWNRLSKDKEMTAQHARLHYLICSTLVKSGKYAEVLDYICESGILLESVLGQNNRWTMKMKYCKGIALKELGEYSKSLEVLTNVYEKQKETFGEKNGDCLITATEVGNVYRELGEYEEAMKYHTKALENAERIFGVEDVRTITLKNDIANTLAEQNKLAEAMKMYKEVLKVRERFFGAEESYTLSVKHNIASVKLKQKDYGEALEEFHKVLEVQERVLELNHSSTLETKYHIALTYYLLGRQEESHQLLKEVYRNLIQILGLRHPKTISTLAQILELLRSSSTAGIISPKIIMII